MYANIISTNNTSIPPVNTLNTHIFILLEGRGDMILWSVALREYRKFIGNDKKIDVVCNHPDIFKYCPYINNAFNSIEYLQENRNYDICILLRDEGFESTQFIKHTNSTYKYGFSSVGITQNEILFTHYLVKNHEIWDHIVQQSILLMLSLGIPINNYKTEFWMPSNYKSKYDKLNYIAYVPFSSDNIKNIKNIYHSEILKLLLNNYSYSIVIIGDKRRISETEDFLLQLDPLYHDKIYNSVGKTDFHDAADLIKNSEFVISMNTSMIHVASAFNKPVVDINCVHYRSNFFRPGFMYRWEPWLTPYISVRSFSGPTCSIDVSNIKPIQIFKAFEYLIEYNKTNIDNN